MTPSPPPVVNGRCSYVAKSEFGLGDAKNVLLMYDSSIVAGLSVSEVRR